MKALLPLSVLVVLFLAACKKETALPPPYNSAPYYPFLHDNRDYMYTKINNERYTWSISPPYNFISQIWVKRGDQQQSQCFRFYTTLCDAKFEIYTPAYATKTQLFSDILSVGKKQVGSGEDQFQIKITIPIGLKETYHCVGTHTTDGNQEESYFEIMQSRKGFDAQLKKEYQQVWIKFACKVYSETDRSVAPLKTGIAIVRFLE